MKNSKKILVMLMTLGLCTAFAACGSTAGNTGGDSKQAESATENKEDEKVSETESETEADEQKSDQTEDTAKTTNVGVIAWSLGMGDEREFVEAVQTNLSEQYSEQIDEVFVMDAQTDVEALHMILENMMVMWEDENSVILLVNGEDGFSDEDLLSVLKNAEKAGVITGVDHDIDGAPESTFVYDASDAAGCAAMTVENAFK